MEYGKSFVHNGLKYQRSEDTVLFTLRNKNNRYIGINLGRKGNEFIIEKTVLTTSDEAFIFMMDKEIFEERLRINLEEKNRQFVKMFDDEPIAFEDIFEEYYEYGQQH